MAEVLDAARDEVGSTKSPLLTTLTVEHEPLATNNSSDLLPQ